MKTPPENIVSAWCRRRDRLTAQRVGVGVVFLKMLGAPDAAEYLGRSEVPLDVAARVLGDEAGQCRDGDCPPHSD